MLGGSKSSQLPWKICRAAGTSRTEEGEREAYVERMKWRAEKVYRDERELRFHVRQCTTFSLTRARKIK